MTIAIIGATGFIGRKVVAHVLGTTGHRLTVFARSADKADFGRVDERRLNRIAGKIDDKQAVARAVLGADVALYLVHLMGGEQADFYEAEARAATVFSEAAVHAGLTRVIYLGGLGNAAAQMSQHLESRNNTGHILAAHIPTVIELRAPMIVGQGSVGFDVLRTMIQKSPVVPIPSWGDQLSEPIAWQDVVEYLGAAIDLDVQGHQIVEIGGPERLTYDEIARRYADWAGRHRAILKVPGIPQAAVAAVVSHFKSEKAAAVGADMVESLSFPMVVHSDAAARFFPQIQPQKIEVSFY